MEYYSVARGELPPELAAALDFPDYKEDGFFDNFLDLFKKKELNYNADSVKRNHLTLNKLRLQLLQNYRLFPFFDCSF